MKIKVGFVPLCDAAPLIVARSLGLFNDEQLQVELVALSSWAEVRDRLITGDVQAAHCLAGIPLAAQAGLFGPRAALVTAFTLNHYGNALTLATALAATDGEIREYARVRHVQGRPITLASVFPVSKHHYELRHWLIRQGLDPEIDVRIVVTPPMQVAAALRDGSLDGFCVGEPWNTRAILDGSGVAVATSRALGLPGTEKVLAVRSDFCEDPAHAALLRALQRACNWLGEPVNRVATAELLAPYLDCLPEELLPALTGRFAARAGSAAVAIEDFTRFHGVNRPDPAHAHWYLEQMQAAGQIPEGIDRRSIVDITFRTDLYDRFAGSARALDALKI